MAKSPHQNRSCFGERRELVRGVKWGGLAMPFQILCCHEGGPGGTGAGGLHPVGEDEKLRPVEEEGLTLRPGTRVPNCQLRPRGAVALSIAPHRQPPVKWVWGPDFLTLSPANTMTNPCLSGGELAFA